MTPQTLFKICNTIAPLGWLLLLVAPRWSWTRKIVVSGILPLMLGLVYLTVILLYFGQAEGNFNSLEGVMKLFDDPFVVVAGWVHYLAFDLFIGSWELTNGQKLGIHHLLLVPCLIFTFLFGPIGLLMYFTIRAIKTKQMIHENF
jgi:Domain of unknown function (DUF4281)